MQMLKRQCTVKNISLSKIKKHSQQTNGKQPRQTLVAFHGMKQLKK